MFKGIILHWTAGNYKPCSHDLKAYHFIIDGEGVIHKGIYDPKDNEKIIGDRYAAHCGGGNTGRIGISICCMRNTNTPPVRKQIETMCELAAKLCFKYGLTPDKCMTHAKFGLLNPKTSSRGKIDINFIPYEGITGIEESNDYLRRKVLWYYNEMKNGKRKKTL